MKAECGSRRVRTNIPSVIWLLVCMFPTIVYASVDSDMEIYELTEAVKAGKYRDAVFKFNKIEESGVTLPISALYFRGLAEFKLGVLHYEKSQIDLKKYAENVGREGRYYREAIEMLTELKHWQPAWKAALKVERGEMWIGGGGVRHYRKDEVPVETTWAIYYEGHCKVKVVKSWTANDQAHEWFRKAEQRTFADIPMDLGKPRAKRIERSHKEQAMMHRYSPRGDYQNYYTLHIGGGVTIEDNAGFTSTQNSLDQITDGCRDVMQLGLKFR